MAQTLLSAAQVDDLVAGYQAGEQVASLATRFGIHRNTVTAHLRRRSAQRPRGLSAQQAAQVVVLYVKQQWTLEEIGREFGVSQRTVGRIMSKAGVLRRPAGPRHRHREVAPWTT
ncbi:sigma factor-like helix-turn-helix DNA-binding protein [Nocardioides sp.]|uniref:sigma factor-like helix-turn-helix DNA-binding protein n=1 Tax=Nocardioides sp. TaxID=35761 RepID=UPI0039E5492E